MNENRWKDECVMKLLNAIKLKGIDIETIFNENVRTPNSMKTSIEENIDSTLI